MTPQHSTQSGSSDFEQRVRGEITAEEYVRRLNERITARAKPAPTWKCEYCGKFYSERTAAKHGWCQQEQDRKDAESMWPA